MLPFQNRLKKEKDFQRVFLYGKTINSNILTIKFLDNNTQETKVGFVVSKKISLKATDRNQIKRVLREEIKREISQIKKGIDMIIIVKGKILKLAPAEIKASLVETLKRAVILIE